MLTSSLSNSLSLCLSSLLAALGGGAGQAASTPDVLPIRATCLDTIRDQQNPGSCIGASSTPTLGSLFPLSSELFVDPTGRVGIGTISPFEKLHVTGPIRSDSANGFFRTNTYSGGSVPSFEIRHSAAPNTWLFFQNPPSSTSWGDLNIVSRASSTTGSGVVHFLGMQSDTVSVTVDGDISARALTVRGADLVEGFEVVAEARVPGTLLIVDPAGSGKLLPSSAPYQTQVIGAVSGAAGVRPGLQLAQEGVSDRETKVAMVGQIYLWCTDESGPIAPGDLITTSSTPGHGMRASDPSRAFGAVVGKAIRPLNQGTGLVLVAINLQ